MGGTGLRPKSLTPRPVLAAQDGGVYYHGTPDERTWEHGAGYGIHIGTEKAARQALNARIGKPHEGEWDGTREYGRTMLAPYNFGSERSGEGHYPSGKASYSGGEPIPLDARPNIFPVRIVGPMTNTPQRPHEDFHANGYMRGQIRRGRAKSGYYYGNVSEDEGSISAVVPSAAHLERVHPPRQAAVWSPSSGIFAPTTGLDPQLFDGDSLRPGVRGSVMEKLDRCLRVDSGLAGSDWQQWLHVWIAGGSASEWAGNRPNDTARDLDVIVGVDLAGAQGNSSFEGMDQAQAATALNAAFRHLFNDPDWHPDFGGIWSLTAYCNPHVGSDITVIRPYAAWDLTDGRWAVRPPHLPQHSIADFDPSVVAHARAVLAEARAILRMPEPLRTREARSLWQHVHEHRCEAFSAEGTGWEDVANVDEKWLQYAPGGVLSKIKELAYASPGNVLPGNINRDHEDVHPVRAGEARRQGPLRVGSPQQEEWQQGEVPEHLQEVPQRPAGRPDAAVQDRRHAAHLHEMRSARDAGDVQGQLLSGLREDPAGRSYGPDDGAKGRLVQVQAQHSSEEGLRDHHRGIRGDAGSPGREVRDLPSGSRSVGSVGPVRGSQPRDGQETRAAVRGVQLPSDESGGRPGAVRADGGLHQEARVRVEAASAAPSGLDFEYFQPGTLTRGGRPHIHTLVAHHDDAPDDRFPHEAGHIQWRGEDGKITSVSVYPPMQRQGIATELLRRAQEITPGVTISHATGEALSDDARAWADALGNRTAAREEAAPTPATVAVGHGMMPITDVLALPSVDSPTQTVAEVLPSKTDDYWRGRLAGGPSSIPPVHIAPAGQMAHDYRFGGGAFALNDIAADSPGQLMLGNGHHRVKEMQSLGWTRVPWTSGMAESDQMPDGRTAAREEAAPDPLRNRVTGGVEWYHGSDHPEQFESFDPARSRYAQEEGEGTGRWWNSRLGPHFTTQHHVATDLSQNMGEGHVYHARLHIGNPMRYPAESSLARHGADWAVENGDLNPALLKARRKGSGYDEALNGHPRAQEIADGFREHLRRSGFDGITYGNEFEGGYGHESAIALHPGQVHIIGAHPNHEPGLCDQVTECPQCHEADVERSDPYCRNCGEEVDLGGTRHTAAREDAWEDRDEAAFEDTDRYVHCGQGHQHWGSAGAAGLLIRHKGDDGQHRYLLQHRSPYVQHGGTWSTPGGALHHGEEPEAGARREADEEFGSLPRGLKHHHTFSDDHGGWAYHTVVMDSPRRFSPHGGGEGDWETQGHGWFTPEEMKGLQLHPGFAASWAKVRKSGAVEKTGGYVPGTPLYHGSLSQFAPGTFLTPEGRDPEGSSWSGDHVYASESPEAARYFGSMHDTTPLSNADVHVHRVEPVGDVEPDEFPEGAEDERFARGNYRAKALRVLDGYVMPGHWAARTAAYDPDSRIVRNTAELGWGDDEWAAARREPWHAASKLAQQQVRLDHPKLGMRFPDQHSGGDEMVGRILGHAGYQGDASGAFVARHPNPEARTSNPSWLRGAPGVALHPERWDYGTVAHECAHHAVMYDHAAAPNEHQPDEQIHGPEWAGHYASALNRISKGAGDDFLGHHRFYRDMIGEGLQYKRPGDLDAADRRRREQGGPIVREGAADGTTIRMVPPEEYRKYAYPDYPAKGLPALAKHLRKLNPAYYQTLRDKIEAGGVDEPVLARFRQNGSGRPLRQPQMMNGHHRAAIAHELGLRLPVGDYDNQADYDAANEAGKGWFSEYGELKAQGKSPWRTEAAYAPPWHDLAGQEPNHAVFSAVQDQVRQAHPELSAPVADPTGTMRKMLGRASFILPKEEIEAAQAPPGEHDTLGLAHHAAHVITDSRQKQEDAVPRQPGERRPQSGEMDPDDRRHGHGFAWHYALALDGAGHRDAADDLRGGYAGAQVRVADHRHALGLARDFPGSDLSPHMPPDQGDLPEMPESQRKAMAPGAHRNALLDVAKNPEAGTRIWRGERRKTAEHTPDAESVGMHWSVHPANTITDPYRRDEGERPVLWQARLEHPQAQAIPRSHPMWNGVHMSLDNEAEVRLRPGSSVHVEGAWVGQPGGGSRPVYPLSPGRNGPGWEWHPVDHHIPVSHRPGNGHTIDYSDVGIPKEAAAGEPERLTLYRGEGSHEQRSYYPKTGPDALAGAWWTSSLESARGYAASAKGGVYQIQVHPHEAKPSGAAGNYLITDPKVRERRTPLEEHSQRKEAAASDGPWYHGTNVDIGEDNPVTPGHRKNFGEGKSTHVYFTESEEGARGYANWVAGTYGGEPHVYEVKPELTSGWEPVGGERAPGTPREYKTRAWLRTVRELPARSRPMEHEAVTGYDGLTKRSGMIYLDLPDGAVRHLPGGVDDHHITLVYLGKDVSDEQFEEALRRAKEAAGAHPPMEGSIGGLGSFPPSDSSDGKKPVFVPVDVPGIHKLRKSLEDLSGSEHGFHPHVTLAYLEDGEAMPKPHPTVPVSFGRLHVKRGDDIRSFPFGGQLSKSAAWNRSGSERHGVYLRFGEWPHDERSFSPAGGYNEEGVSVYDLDDRGNPSIDHGLDRGHVHDPDWCDEDCQDHLEDPDNDPREEMQGRVKRAERHRYYGDDRPGDTGHLVKGDVSGVGYDGEPLLKNVRRVGDWIDHRHQFIYSAAPHHLARDESAEDYEPPEEKPGVHRP